MLTYLWIKDSFNLNLNFDYLKRHPNIDTENFIYTSFIYNDNNNCVVITLKDNFYMQNNSIGS